jgi:NAD(P)-dependent dehydrogenase (short-subunit alcohol dehydrogenase family)
MARILITGSADGLGSWTAQRLVKKGHSVVLHARNAQRAKDATAACPGAETVVIGDLSSLAQTKALAEEVNKLGTFDAIIHNAALLRGGFRKTEDGMPSLTAVNTMAPYILTCLINKPKYLVFLSSAMHFSGDTTLRDITWEKRGERAWSDDAGYSDSKLHTVLFAKAFGRRWPDVKSNVMNPGWVNTRMGGPRAPDSPEAAMDTYEMLATGEGLGGKTGKYFDPSRRERSPKFETKDVLLQDELLKICEEVTGVKFSN